MTSQIRGKFGLLTMVVIALLATAIAPGMTALAQQTMSGLALSGDEPIQIESDKLSVKDEEGRAIFTGNVKVVQGKTTMQSGNMTVFYAKDGGSASAGTSQIDRIVVGGKVYIKTEEQEATADDGVFDMKSDTVILTGDKVVLTDGSNVFVGCKLTVLMQSGEAKLDSCGGRVRIQLDPKSNK